MPSLVEELNRYKAAQLDKQSNLCFKISIWADCMLLNSYTASIFHTTISTNRTYALKKAAYDRFFIGWNTGKKFRKQTKLLFDMFRYTMKKLYLVLRLSI